MVALLEAAQQTSLSLLHVLQQVWCSLLQVFKAKNTTFFPPHFFIISLNFSINLNFVPCVQIIFFYFFYLTTCIFVGSSLIFYHGANFHSDSDRNDSMLNLKTSFDQFQIFLVLSNLNHPNPKPNLTIQSQVN